MPNVLIRDVPGEDLEQIRSAAADRGLSLQAYMRAAIHAQAAQLRRREALVRTAERLRGLPRVSDEERQAVLEAIDADHSGRAEQLIDRPDA